MSPGIEKALKTIAPVIRLGGADRFVTSLKVNSNAFTASAHVYLATGYDFPDGLTGATLAGMQSAPIFLVKTNCVPSYMVAKIASMGANRITLLGGPAALTPAVKNLTPCKKA